MACATERWILTRKSAKTSPPFAGQVTIPLTTPVAAKEFVPSTAAPAKTGGEPSSEPTRLATRWRVVVGITPPGCQGRRYQDAPHLLCQFSPPGRGVFQHSVGVSLFVNGVQVVVSAALVVISHADLSTRSTHSDGIGPIESKLPDPPLGSSHRTRSTSSPARQRWR